MQNLTMEQAFRRIDRDHLKKRIAVSEDYVILKEARLESARKVGRPAIIEMAENALVAAQNQLVDDRAAWQDFKASGKQQ